MIVEKGLITFYSDVLSQGVYVNYNLQVRRICSAVCRFNKHNDTVESI